MKTYAGHTCQIRYIAKCSGKTTIKAPNQKALQLYIKAIYGSDIPLRQIKKDFFKTVKGTKIQYKNGILVEQVAGRMGGNSHDLKKTIIGKDRDGWNIRKIEYKR